MNNRKFLWQAMIVSLFLPVSLLINAGYAQASDWSVPVRIMQPSVGLCYNKRPSITSDGTKIVFMATAGWGPSDVENNSKIKIIEYSGGTWGSPVDIAANGHYSYESFQWLPWHTEPVISGNGNTIAYAGYDADSLSAQIYIVDRQGVGAWSAPYKLNTGLENHDSIVSLSADGNTVAYASRPFNIFGATPVMYVSVRTDGVWGAKTAISLEDSGGAFNPSLSDDGARIVWVQNEKIVFSEKIANGWTQPKIIAENKYGESALEYPVISSDGTMVAYWQVNLVSSGSSSVRQSKDLYLIQRTALGWSGPRKISSSSVVPGFYVDGPAGVSGLFNRIAYSRSRIITDSIGDVMTGANLELAELPGDNNWVAKSLTSSADNIWDVSPSFSRDGNTIIYSGTDTSSSYGCTTFWATKTSESNTTALRSVSGTVTFKGAPLPGVNISLTGGTTAETMTDLSGNYGLTGFSDGAYTVTPSRSGFSFTPARTDVTIAGASASGKDFTAANNPNTISYFGSVVDSDSRILPDSTIEVVGNPSLTTKSDANGNFLLAGIPAGADFSLKITGQSAWYLPVYSQTYNTTSNIWTRSPFILHGSQDFDNFSFGCGAFAEGRLFRAGNPRAAVEGAVITCTSKNHPSDCSTVYPIAYNTGSGLGGAATSANGIYYIYGIENEDVVTVTATKEGWRFPTIKFTAHREDCAPGISEPIATSIVDLTDMIACLQILAGKSPQIANSVLDFNNDGKIDQADVVYIVQHLAELR